LRKYQAFLAIAVVAAPAGLAGARIFPVWSQLSALTGIGVSVICVVIMALLRCPNCHVLLGLSEAAREFQSNCCPNCGVDLRR
jgi:anaerobic selenocysteine-containing dehydrogenase